MLPGYKQTVINFYLEKRRHGRLSAALTHPTPGALKEECVHTLALRFDEGDQVILSSFFGRQPDMAAFEKAIRKFDTEKLKPLCNFMNRKTNETSNKNIELLAWLIDFRYRPYNMVTWLELEERLKNGQNLMAGEAEKEEVSAGGSTDDPAAAPAEEKVIADQVVNEQVTDREDPPEAEVPPADGASGQPEGSLLAPGEKEAGPRGQKERQTLPVLQRRKSRRIWVSIAVAVLLVLAMALFKTEATENQQCMYWDGEQYKRITCTAQATGRLVVALDTSRLQLRKITQPDTITLAALGKVWYKRLQGRIEFYTGPGYHPVYPEMELKPITAYIISRHCGKQAGKPALVSR